MRKFCSRVKDKDFTRIDSLGVGASFLEKLLIMHLAV